MNLYVQQSISIGLLRINSVSNSSVLQIGSAGIIRPASYLSNTGGFTESAPTTTRPDQIIQTTIPPAVRLFFPEEN